jgi:MOSC domain-containing protein YiiM
LARKLGEPRLVDWVIDAHQGGIYVRVLEEGRVAADAALELLTQHPDRISIATVNDVIYDRVRDRALIQHLATMPEFSVAGRERMAKKLERQG